MYCLYRVRGFGPCPRIGLQVFHFSPIHHLILNHNFEANLPAFSAGWANSENGLLICLGSHAWKLNSDQTVNAKWLKVEMSGVWVWGLEWWCLCGVWCAWWWHEMLSAELSRLWSCCPGCPGCPGWPRKTLKILLHACKNILQRPKNTYNPVYQLVSTFVLSFMDSIFQ